MRQPYKFPLHSHFPPRVGVCPFEESAFSPPSLGNVLTFASAFLALSGALFSVRLGSLTMADEPPYLRANIIWTSSGVAPGLTVLRERQ